MSAIGISLVVFMCVFASALLGVFLRSVLPPHHLSEEAKATVQLATKLVVTVTALVLSLMIASANGFRDTQATELTQASANIVLLDRTLAEYGPESKQARSVLKEKLAFVLEKISSKDYSRSHGDLGTGVVYDEVQQLSPKDDMQRQLKNQALTIARSVAQVRWLVYEQRAHSVSSIVLAILVFWLMLIFASFGLFAPTNGTVLTSLFFSASAVSGAVLLLLEMYTPYTGLIRISSEPLRVALASLGQ